MITQLSLKKLADCKRKTKIKCNKIYKIMIINKKKKKKNNLIIYNKIKRNLISKIHS